MISESAYAAIVSSLCYNISGEVMRVRLEGTITAILFFSNDLLVPERLVFTSPKNSHFSFRTILLRL